MLRPSCLGHFPFFKSANHKSVAIQVKSQIVYAQKDEQVLLTKDLLPVTCALAYIRTNDPKHY